MKIDILTLFPEMFAPMDHSVMKNAQDKGLLEWTCHNFRDFAINRHGHVDDYPYGGGAGMLLRPEPIVHCLEAIPHYQDARVVLVDPIGQPFSQQLAQELAQEDHLIFICGHYEGFDERVRAYVDDQVSLGDYVLTNGELPTMVMVDATVRLIPGVVGNEESIVHESFQVPLLEHPQYTRPLEFRQQLVPEVLVSGHHAKISQWRHRESLRRTYLHRPDLLEDYDPSPEERAWLEEFAAEDQSQDADD